jgi:phosphatidylserine/phosphatidylglycerophosphate/cardiolipin synthase-like enzyme
MTPASQLCAPHLVDAPLLRLVPQPSPHSLLLQPEAGIEPLLDALDHARYRVFVKMFKLTSEPLIERLAAAARRGVAVRVMLNPSRSDGSRANDEAFERLQQAGVEVQWTHPAFYVTHEKSMVVDHIAFICTFNFAEKYFTKTRGYAIVTRDSAEVDEVVAGFDADWDRRDFQPYRLVWSQGAQGNTRQRVSEFFESARSSIEIQNPKLVDEQSLNQLIEACRRGVRVRFLSSGLKCLSHWDIAENTAAMKALREVGARVRELKRPKVHAKLILVDRQRALVGSMNLDRSCFELRRELGVIVENPIPLGELSRQFELDWSRAES